MESNEQPSTSKSLKKPELLNCEECGVELWYLSKEDYEILKREFAEDFSEKTRVLCEFCEPEPDEEQKLELLRDMHEC